MPKISILMGVYNCADTVHQSIDSIMQQTFTDWEFIICDDGSVDNTVQIVEKYAEKDPRIILIKNDKNYGLSYTLNHCLKYATGEYCARMDGDDICVAERFKIQVDFLDNHPEYGFVSSLMTRHDENGVYQVPDKKESYAPQKMDFVKGSPYCHAPVMMRKSSYDAVNGYRDIDKTLGVEDYDMWFRLYEKGIYGYVLHQPLYSMFDGRAAASRRTFNRRINEAWVRKEGYKMIGIPFLYRIYVLKPIVLAFIPQWLYKIIR